MKDLYFIFLVLMLASCGSKQQQVETVTDTIETQLSLNAAQVEQAEITTGTAEVMTMHTTLKANGVVDVPPQNIVSVSFPLGGYLKSTRLLPGSIVRRGQVIASMEDQSYVQLQQEYLVAKARMEYLSEDVKRQKTLSDEDAASLKQYQQVLSDYKTQQVLIRSLEEKLRIIGINPSQLSVSRLSRAVAVRSPIDGYVADVKVNIGKYVNPSEVLFELINPSDIHAAVNVFEKDLPSIYKGLRGFVSLADNPSKQYEVDVLMVSRNISETRTGVVHCHFKNINKELLPGMFLVANFNLGTRQVYAVPENAIVRYGGKYYVFIANGNNYQMKEVVPGVTQNGKTEIMEDPRLAWNKTQVVTNGAYALLGKLKNKSDE